MQKSTCKYLTFTIYRHVACRAVTMVTTMGSGRQSRGGTARAQLSQASYMQWSFFGGVRGVGVLWGGNAYRQQCRTSLKATVIHLEYSHLIFFFPFGWKKSPQIQKRNKVKAPSTNTDGNKIETEIVYVQMHILYTSVHPAAAEPPALGSRQEVMGAGHV